jgi:hypothetical protein
VSVFNLTEEQKEILGGDITPEKFKELWPFLTKKDQRKFARVGKALERLFGKKTWSPQSPTERQALFLGVNDVREVFYGGAAGGGKSSCLLMAALEHVNTAGYSALLLRRTYADLSKPGALMDRAAGWLRNTEAKWNEQKKQWTFPSGATLTFGYLDTENDKYQFQGAEFQFCTAEGTKIKMADGSLRAVEMLRVGDLVQTLRGARKVTLIAPKRRAECVEARVNGQSQVHTTNHRVLTTEGWLSYDDMIGVFRPSGSLESTEIHSVDRFSCKQQQKSPFALQRFSYQPNRQRQQLSPSQLHVDRRGYEAIAAYLTGTQSDSVMSVDGYQETQRPVTLFCRAVLHEPSVRLSRNPQGAHCEVAHGRPSTFPLDFQGDYLSFARLDDERPRPSAVSGLNDPQRQVGVAAQSRTARSSRSRPPLRYDHSRLILFAHPYTTDRRYSDEACEFGTLAVSPIGARDVYDITVEGESHYITESGLVQANCGFDELSQFTESQYLYLFSRLRRLEGSDIPLRMRSASNPGGVGARWVYKRFIPETFTPNDATKAEVWWKEGTDESGREFKRAFIPAKLQDNPHLDREQYEEFLNELDPITREQLLRGDWLISERGDILSMWDEKYHVISWREFKNVFGEANIPAHWLLGVYQDVGTTNEHPCVTSWFATAPKNAPLSGSVFLYRGLTVTDWTPRQIAEEINRLMLPRREKERVNRWRMSHEASSERLAYRREHGIPFDAWATGKTRGIAQLRNALEIVNKDKPHPFRAHLQGSPRLYLVVDDDELIVPTTDAGLARHRAEIPAYHWAMPKSGEAPATLVPYALFNDAIDTIRAGAADYFPLIKELTEKEQIERAIPEKYKRENLITATGGFKDAAAEMSFNFQMAQAKQRVQTTQMISFDEAGMPIGQDQSEEYASIW